MSTSDGDIVIQRSVGDNPYMGEGMSGASDLLNSYDGDKVNGVEIHTCSRTVKNDATGEVIMASSNRGGNETVEHIVNSIKCGSKRLLPLMLMIVARYLLPAPNLQPMPIRRTELRCIVMMRLTITCCTSTAW